MSSSRGRPVCDGVVVCAGQPVGPLRLPLTRADDFVDQFNRTYQSVGLSVEENAAEPENGSEKPAR